MSARPVSVGSVPALLGRCVHVWIADLSTDAACAREALASAEERERAERSLRTGAARARLRARGLLRELLALYAGIDARELELPNPRATHLDDVHFSVSHSHSLALLAFARGSAVGVDLEVRTRQIDAPRVAARAFGARESASLRELPREAQLGEFLRMWTLHEARAKCVGAGMWRFAHTAPSPSAPDGPSLTELGAALPPIAFAARAAAAAALAVAERGYVVRVLDWNRAR